MTEAELRKHLVWGWWWSSTHSPDEELPPRPPEGQEPQEFIDWLEMGQRALEDA